MKSLNWHKFFFRLTVVLSVAIGIRGVYVVSEQYDILQGIVAGVVFCGVVWIIYFCIRWIFRGLKGGDPE